MTEYQEFSPLDLPQCIYLSENCKCSILSVRKCRGNECPFRRSELDYKNSQQQWRDHLNAISIEQQNKISREYYGGKKLW